MIWYAQPLSMNLVFGKLETRVQFYLPQDLKFGKFIMLLRRQCCCKGISLELYTIIIH